VAFLPLFTIKSRLAGELRRIIVAGLAVVCLSAFVPAQSVLVTPNAQSGRSEQPPQSSPPPREPASDGEGKDAEAQTQKAAEQLPVSTTPAVSAQSRGPAVRLYVQLRDAGLDAAHVYRIRDAFIDREDLHVKIEDGLIGFSQAVDGHVTGGFFEGEGEALLSPPDNVERWSLNVFTGSPILEERFQTAFLRFNDDTFKDLQPNLRPVERDEAVAFVAKWDAATRQLSATGALRTATTILNAQQLDAAGNQVGYMRDPNDRLLVLRVFGTRVGPFDLIFDSEQPEQITVGHLTRVGPQDFYDVWTSFPARSSRGAMANASKRSTIATQASAETGAPEPFVVSKYAMKVQVTPPHTIRTDATLDVAMRQGGTRVLRFELSRYLKVSEALADGRPIDFLQNEALQGSALARRGDDVVALVFPKLLRAGQKIQLRLVYEGDVMTEAGGGLMYVGSRGAWYPNRGLAMSDYDMEFRYPASWSLVATGKRVAQSQTPQGGHLDRYQSERPLPLAGFNLGKYTSEQAQADNVSVAAYAASGVEEGFPGQRTSVMIVPDLHNPHRANAIVTPPPSVNPTHNLKHITEHATQDLEFLSRRLGPYPFSALSLTQMPGPDSNSWPGLMFLSSYVFLTPEERRAAHLGDWANLLYGDLMQTHESVHQWIGDLVIWRSYREQWIVEALSNYCALLKVEQTRPADAQAILAHYRDELLSKNADGVEVTEAGPVTMGVRLNSSRFPTGYEAISYGRGTWLFHTLRHMLLEGTGAQPGPDEPFFQALRKIRQRFEGREITTRDLQQVFEEYVPESLRYENRKSLDWFFDTWVNGKDIPRIELDDVKFTTANGVTTVRGKIVQKHAADTLVTSVPLYSGTGAFLGRVFAEGPESTFRLKAPRGTNKLVVDPHGTLLKR
jgi:Peptidase family M1 domain